MALELGLGVIIGWIVARDGRKIPIYAPQKEVEVIREGGGRVEVTFPNLIYTQAKGYTVISAKKRVIITQPQKVLPDNVVCSQVVIRADVDNRGTVWVGDASVSIGDGYPLQPNDAIAIPVSKESEPYINGNLGDKVYWLVVG